MACSQGALSKLCVEPGASAHTFDTSSEPYEFVRENLQKRSNIADTEGIRGTRSHHAARTRLAQNVVAGSILFHPSPADLDLWLPRILGANESTDTFALAETLQTFGVLIDRVADTHEYQDCWVNRATFRSQQGGFLEMELDIIGKAEVTGTSYPALTLPTDAHDAPYVHSDSSGAVTLVSAARETKSIEITIDNQLEPRFVNSLNATEICPRDRIITVRTVHSYAGHTALYEQAVAGTTGSIVYTNAAMSTTFTFGLLQVPDSSPVVPGKQEIDLTLDMVARMTGATRELVVTHDSVA